MLQTESHSLSNSARSPLTAFETDTSRFASTDYSISQDLYGLPRDHSEDDDGIALPLLAIAPTTHSPIYTLISMSQNPGQYLNNPAILNSQNIKIKETLFTPSASLFDTGLDSPTAMNIILRPQRDLDIKGASLLQQKVFSLFPAPPNSNWVIDLVQVQTIDHFGLTTLVTIRQAARHYQCHLYLFNLKPSVRYMLSITELESEFKTVENLETLFTDGLRIVLC